MVRLTELGELGGWLYTLPSSRFINPNYPFVNLAQQRASSINAPFLSNIVGLCGREDKK